MVRGDRKLFMMLALIEKRCRFFEDSIKIGNTPLTVLKGIGTVIDNFMKNNGIFTVEELAEVKVEDYEEIMRKKNIDIYKFKNMAINYLNGKKLGNN